MEKLKTLKDFEIYNTGLSPVVTNLFYELRKEAIKWIKWLEKGYYEDHKEGIKKKAYEEISDPTDVPEMMKIFFNITEEDLK